MKKQIDTERIINNINYKDILIILGTWYFMIAINYLTTKFNFDYLPFFNGFLHFLFITSGRFIYLALFIFYHISLYSASFKEIGLKFYKTRQQLLTAILLLSVLFVFVIVFINIPLSFQTNTGNFTPLYRIENPEILIKSFMPLLLLFVFNIIIALSELIILIVIIFELFNYKLNSYISLVLSALFYSVLMLEFLPEQIFINFITAIICIFAYIKTSGSLFISALFLAGFNALYILYIYGWSFIRF